MAARSLLLSLLPDRLYRLLKTATARCRYHLNDSNKDLSLEKIKSVFGEII